MSDMKALARTAMASKMLADAARDEGAEAREALVARMTDVGSERMRVKGDDDVDYGTLVMVPGSRRAQVADDKAFVDWVAKRYPDEMVLLVRPAFRDRLLATATRLGDPVDSETGEVIPGVEISQGDPYLTVRPSAVAKERMRSALAANGLLALGQSGEVS